MNGEYFLSIAQVCEKVSVSSSFIYERINEGTFPLPIQLGGMSRWRGAEVDEWMAALANQPRSLRTRTSPKGRAR